MAEYYIKRIHAGTSSGTLANPWKSFSDAYTWLLAGGNLTEDATVWVMDYNNGGTQSGDYLNGDNNARNYFALPADFPKWVTFRADPTNTQTIRIGGDGTTTTSVWAFAQTIGHIEFRDLTMYTSGSAVTVFKLGFSSSNLNVNGLKLTDVLIDGNNVTNSIGIQIEAKNAAPTASTMTGIELTRVAVRRTKVRAVGMRFQDSGSALTATITDLNVQECTGDGLITDTADNPADTGALTLTITRPYMRGLTGSCVFLGPQGDKTTSGGAINILMTDADCETSYSHGILLGTCNSATSSIRVVGGRVQSGGWAVVFRGSKAGRVSNMRLSQGTGATGAVVLFKGSVGCLLANNFIDATAAYCIDNSNGVGAQFASASNLIYGNWLRANNTAQFWLWEAAKDDGGNISQCNRYVLNTTNVNPYGSMKGTACATLAALTAAWGDTNDDTSYEGDWLAPVGDVTSGVANGPYTGTGTVQASAVAAAASAQIAADQLSAPAAKRMFDTTIGGVAGSIAATDVLDSGTGALAGGTRHLVLAGTLGEFIAQTRAQMPDGGAKVAAKDDLTGIGAGNGDIRVDHDTGGTDNLQLLQGGVPVDNATVEAYLPASPTIIRGTAYTDTNGRWANPMMLNAGTYKFRFRKDAVTVEVSQEVA